MKFKLTGNYGTFEITKIVEADDIEEAWEHTGIMMDLLAAGWTFTETPDGEDWDIQTLEEP